MNKKCRRLLIASAGCLLTAAVLLLLCSQCSPLFPTNVWGDANCLLTVGRVMRSGGVLYRDIYEQKGPTLYLIHAIAAMIDGGSFFGVYVMEVLSLAAALFAAFKILRARLCMRGSLAGVVLLGAGLLVCTAFMQGDSAEEFCLPYLLGALYAMTACLAEDGTMRPRALFACGLAAGMVATIKYGILGLFVGLCLAEGVAALRAGGMQRALRSAGVFLAGMLLPIALWVVYFAANGALGDFYTAYIYNNIFLYDAQEGLSAAAAAKAVLHYLADNALWVVPAALGVVCTALDRGMRGKARLGVLLAAACSVLAVCFLGRLWVYCPLVLGVFAVFGLRALLERFAMFMTARGWLWYRRGTLPACAALALALALFASPNAYLRGEKMENLAQHRLAQHIPAGASLLQYSHLDDGLYLAADTLPQQKYFVRLNVAYDDMRAELDRYAAEAIPEYVLVSWRPLPEQFDRYQLIAEDAGYDDEGRVNKALYLYRRK